MSKRIKLLAMDVDGTLTDGKIYMGNNGEVCKAFSIKDGCGIHDLLIPAKIKPVIITGRYSQILENRCKELGITELYQGITDKIQTLNNILKEKGLSYNNVAYIGDDINDLECMKIIRDAGGIVGCPADSAGEIINLGGFISRKNGGDGAVREFIEYLVKEYDPL